MYILRIWSRIRSLPWPFTVAVLYLLIELVRLLRLLRLQKHLHDHRTPLSDGFDRRSWAEFMLSGLKREASLGKNFVSAFVRSIFYEKPVESLSRGDVDGWLRMYLSAREVGVDGPLEPRVKELADDCRSVIEKSLGHRFKDGEATNTFIRINHPTLDHHPIMARLRPLPVEAIFLFLRLATDLWLPYLGYRRWVDESTGFVFWRLRKPQTTTPRRALVFISGLGQGQSLYPHYAHFLARDASLDRVYTDICLCEQPGISRCPLRANCTYPTAREVVAAVQRFTENILDLQSIDAIGHSAGSIAMSYASRYAPGLVSKQIYAESPVFFTHASKSWPLLFKKYPSNRFIMSEVHHQHYIKNTTWFFETCHRGASLGANTMLILGTEDAFVNGRLTAAHFQKFYPTVTVHLMQGWEHGGCWDPRNFSIVKGMMRDFLCGTSDSALKSM